MAISERARKVWAKTFDKPGNRRGLDCCGAEIHKGAYVDPRAVKDGNYGQHSWAIDHIVPLHPKKGQPGKNTLTNTRALHHENNQAKGNSPDGQWICAVGSRKGRPCLPGSEESI